MKELMRVIKGRSKYPYAFKNSNIYYVPVPKNACSSVKKALYQYNFGQEHKIRYLFGQILDSHRYFPSRKFHKIRVDNDSKIFAIVRDPFDRFISCYCNRVLHHKDLLKSEKKIKDAGLELNPSINYFVDHLKEYQSFSTSIMHHTLSQVSFLGSDTSIYWRIFPISEIKSLEQELSLALKNKIKFIHAQQGGKQHKQQVLSELSTNTATKIREYYNDDYKILAEYLR